MTEEGVEPLHFHKSLFRSHKKVLNGIVSDQMISILVYDHRMDNLGDFLRQRKIPEETIETMLKEKIDTNVIQLMTDEELKSYLPSYGDHLALLGYCKSRENGTPNSHK
ncbi:hypothetical protein XENORESO_003711, partial [Xenotaenia resolanae]